MTTPEFIPQNKEWMPDITRIKTVLYDNFYRFYSLKSCQSLWLEIHGDNWVPLPDTDEELFNKLKKHL